MNTRKGTEQTLNELGVTGIAAEKILIETSEARHNARVKFALERVVTWVQKELYGNEAMLEPVWDLSSSVAAMSAGICLLDEIGVGGRDGVSGAATRFPAFAGCGPFRKQARDGGAWSAAITGAGRQLSEMVNKDGNNIITVCPFVPEDSCWGQFTWSIHEGGIGVELPSNEKWKDGRNDFTPIPVPQLNGKPDLSWHISLARECLRRVLIQVSPKLEVKSWHKDTYFEVSGKPEDWANVLNELYLLKSEQEVNEVI